MARITQQMKSQALRMVLNDKAMVGSLEIWKVGETKPLKTKELKIQGNLRAGDLIVLGSENKTVARAARNIKGVIVTDEAGLVCRQALAAKKVIIDESVWSRLETKFSAGQRELTKTPASRRQK